jgi:hypothetical protein
MQTYSANGIAERLERDRGTCIRALRGTEPDRMVKGRPQWKLSTASRAVEAHIRGYDGGNGDGTDPALAAIYAEFDRQDRELRKLPTLEARRAAALAMAPLIAEQDRAIRAHGRGDPETAALRADQIFGLIIRGFEGPCGWSFEQAFAAMSEADA